MELAVSLPKLEGLETLRARKDVFARQYQIDRILRQLLQSPDEVIPRSLIADLFAHWGDPLNQAGESYVNSSVIHAADTSGHILQCGTGLMTLLMGAICSRSEQKCQHLWCLTDDHHQANVIRSWLTQYRITNTHVVVSRPRIYDGCVWYAIDPCKLPDGFTLALCEGGHASVNSAVGLAQIMDPRLSDECVVLARHVTSRHDQALLQRWSKRRSLQCTLLDKSTGFMKIIRNTSNERS